MKKNRFLVAAILFAAVCTTTLVSCKKDKNAEPKDPSTEQNGDNQNEPPTSDVVTYTLTVLSNDEEMGTVTGGGTYAIGTEATLTATPTSEEYVFVRWSDDNTSSQRVIKVIANETYTAYFDARPSTGSDTDTEDNHEWVDLGLSVKWATCNVGATKPEETGNYFAWGETEAKETYDWSTYKLTGDGGSTFTKYNTTDGKTTLDLTDDAARVNWGGTWRMPTLDECEELVNNCTWTWTENYNNTRVAGRIVTSNINGNSIFLPTTGYYHDNNIIGSSKGGDYWSSSLSTSSQKGKDMFYDSESEEVKISDYERYYGLAVRAVTE